MPPPALVSAVDRDAARPDNFHFRQQIPEFGAAHRYAYDFETLAARLDAAGFADVVRRAFDPASDAEERRVGTLYVRATRP